MADSITPLFPGDPTAGIQAADITDSTVSGRALITAADAAAARAAISAASTREIKTASFTAEVNGRYTSSHASVKVVVTDPSGTVAGQIYSVLVGLGTMDFGSGTVYAASRMEVVRYYSGSAWSTLTPALSDTLALGADLTVAGNTTLGDAAGDTVTVTAGQMRGNSSLAADDATSFMTRSLIDARARHWIWCAPSAVIVAKADGAGWPLYPGGNSNINGNSTPACVPAEMNKFRVRVTMGFTTTPVANVFPIYIRMLSQAINGTGTYIESGTGTHNGLSGLYPDTSGGLTGALTNLATGGGFANTFAFVSDWYNFPSDWKTHAASQGFYGLLQINVGNASGGSLTDNAIQNHTIHGLVEFQL